MYRNMSKYIDIYDFVSSKKKENPIIIDSNIRKKRCTRCYKLKPLNSEFWNHNSHTYDGFLTRCKDCRKELMKLEKYKRTKRKYRRSEKGINKYLERKYNIDLKTLNELKRKQKNKCKICGKNLKDQYGNGKKVNKKDMTVDHNHKTGKVRGLLCNRCNTFLGYCSDNPYIIIRSIKYIQKDGDI